MLKDDLLQRLYRLDEDVDLSIDGNETFHLVLVGGGALILQEYIRRATHDLYAISVSPRIMNLLEKYDINCRVQTYINNFPYNFEDRLIPLKLDTKRIRFDTASLEDIVIAKLYSPRTTDQRDVETDTILRALDWNLLDQLANRENEAKASALNEYRYLEFKARYEDYVRRFRP